jgi:cell wall-associated NlpC family hydrolase
MGRFWGGGPRILSAVLAAVAITVGGFADPAAAVGGTTPSPSKPAPSTTTTLPPLPIVPATYTDGQPVATLLLNAISLASLGVDDFALVSAIAATQARLDADESTARIAESQSRAAASKAAADEAAGNRVERDYASMAGALKNAVVYLYTSGTASLTISPTAGALALYAQDYADSALGPYGVLSQSLALKNQRSQDLRAADMEAKIAEAAAAKAAKALSDQYLELSRLTSELGSASAPSAAAVAADHVSLASQAGTELLGNSALQFTPKARLPVPVSTTSIALTWAFAELGKQYVWGATGPDTFDCSGLSQFVWKAAGVTIPRVAADQDSWAIPVPLSQLLPGDLVFFGTTDIHHVGIYIGDGLMINAPHTGTVVQVSSIWWSDLAGFGRVHDPRTPVPTHDTPSPARPAVPAVLPSTGPVPSQPKPPAGWKPKAGESTPIRLPALPSEGSDTGGSATVDTTTSTLPEPTSTTSPSTSTTTTSTSTTSLTGDAVTPSTATPTNAPPGS